MNVNRFYLQMTPCSIENVEDSINKAIETIRDLSRANYLNIDNPNVSGALEESIGHLKEALSSFEVAANNLTIKVLDIEK